MNEKKWMIQYFHERTYQPQSLEDFEKEVQKAAALGAEYFFLSEVPKRREEWTDMEGDPYPNWGMLQTSLFKLAVPEVLKQWLDADYAEENRKLLKRRSKIIKKYGLKAALILIDPFYLPEEVYRVHPDWRGPRCDHPRRCKKMYFSPCIDSPGVQQLYREALDILWKDVDLHYIQIITNDSGAGVCWTEGLYNGKNGPSSCRHIPLAERLAGFLQIFTNSAKALGHDIMIDLTSDILGYKEPDSSMAAAYGKLESGQMLSGKDRDGYKLVWEYQSLEYEHVRPLKGIAFPLALIRRLWEAQSTDAEYIKLVLPHSVNGEYEAALEAWKNRKSDQYEALLEVYTQTAHKVAGERNGSALLEAWMETDNALTRLTDIHYDNFVMMPLMSQRLINRPLVPRPDYLEEEEISYFWPYLFQATTREQALDYMNIQGMEFVRGFSACRMMRLTSQKAIQHLDKALAAYERMIPDEYWRREQNEQAMKRLAVLKCLIRTMMHAVAWQEILDRTGAEEEPLRQTVWPINGDARLLSMNEICRSEIDNTYELYSLIAENSEEFFVTAESGEDIFLPGKELPQQLLKKAEIMLAHMRDAENIYESSNR